MLYVVSEDKKSGRTFWERVLATVRDLAYEVCPSAGGNKGLADAVAKIAMSRGDKLLLAYDDNGEDHLVTDLKAISSYCANRECEFWVTNYYCFEELMLSYQFIEVLGDCSVPYYLELLKLVREWVCVGSEQVGGYFLADISQKFIREHSAENREQMAHQLLSFVSGGHKPRFGITKDTLGLCWISNCMDVLAKPKVHENGCRKCPWCGKGLSAKEKFDHFKANSMNLVAKWPTKATLFS